jgi:hypothetical protein
VIPAVAVAAAPKKFLRDIMVFCLLIPEKNYGCKLEKISGFNYSLTFLNFLSALFKS